MVSLNSLILAGSRRFLLNKLPKLNSNSPLLKAQNQISVAAFSSTTWREPIQARYANDITSLNNQRTGCVGINVMPKRFKKTKSRGSKKDDDEEEDDDDDDDVEENPLLMDDLGESNEGFEKLVIDVNSLRLDAFAKVAFGATRLKVEESFYKGDLLVNGERPTKKSQDLHLHDEIDMIRGINTDDRNKLDVRRVQIESMPDKATEQGRMKISIKRWQSLTIDAPDRRGRDDD